MARIARPGVLIKEVEDIRSGFSARPGSSSSSPPLSSGAPRFSAAELQEEGRHLHRMLLFIEQYEPPPAFGAGILKKLLDWHMDVNHDAQNASVQFLQQAGRLLNYRVLRVLMGDRHLDIPDDYVARLTHAFCYFYGPEIKYVCEQRNEFDRKMREVARVFSRSK